MNEFRFWQVDCFTNRRYLGNPAAVVFEADALSTDQMQMIARQMNLSETVFLCEPRDAIADYRARIFTPKSELPFAGHPTIAAAFSHYQTKGRNLEPGASLQQECGIGIVPIAVSEHDDSALYTMTVAADPVRGTGLSRADAAALLGLDVNELMMPRRRYARSVRPGWFSGLARWRH